MVQVSLISHAAIWQATRAGFERYKKKLRGVYIYIIYDRPSERAPLKDTPIDDDDSLVVDDYA